MGGGGTQGSSEEWGKIRKIPHGAEVRRLFFRDRSGKKIVHGSFCVR